MKDGFVRCASATVDIKVADTDMQPQLVTFLTTIEPAYTFCFIIVMLLS